MNPYLDNLQPYPFERLNALKQGITPPAGLAHIALSIGEPRHPTPPFIIEALNRHMAGLANYPLTRGLDALRETIAAWLQRRFALPDGMLDPARHVLPVNGTREALFAFAQAVVDSHHKPYVVMPNPFYQIYEGAALLAGARPYFLNTTADTGMLPDFDAVPDAVWAQCALLYVCSPGNPTGAVLDTAAYKKLFALADRFNFIIAADECYSEIYLDEANPPPGLLDAAREAGRTDMRRCVVFHSLSKRSSVPGLRSGFVAGDAGVLAQFLRYRTYHGCAMAEPVQHASIAAWQDEAHVADNRRLYRDKFAAVLEILGPVMNVSMPQAGFYLWPKTPIDDTVFARELFARYNVSVLPGQYLSRDSSHQAGHTPADGNPGENPGLTNPGQNRVRLALVAALADCVEAAQRIRALLEDLAGK